MSKRRITLILTLAALLWLVPAALLGQERPRTSAPQVVLDTMGFWRLHQTLKPPVIGEGGNVKPMLLEQRWLNWETPEPPEDWTAVEFDDGRWLRGTARRTSMTSQAARLCLRGRFGVTDPDGVRGLRLSLAYHGGAVVYVNGRELARKHVVRKTGRALLADDYPPQAFVTERGGYLGPPGAYLDGRPSGQLSAESQRRIGLWRREMANVAIPSQRLRKGVNVLAVEIVRAPYHTVFETLPRGKQAFPYEFTWNTCELQSVQLTAASASGLVPCAVRPKGLQVWNSDPTAGDFDLDFGNPAEPLRPIRLVGARGGTFSGKVVVGSSEPIRGLRAEAGPLKGPAGAIPASCVQVRYAMAWGGETLNNGTYHRQLSPYPAGVSLLDLLVESPPREVPVRTKGSYGRRADLPNLPKPVFGAVVPVWVTVSVPRDAAPGIYTGQIAIRVAAGGAVRVPLEIKVADWLLPEPERWRTWVELMQSPDTLAVEYDVPLWSPKHWALVARSMDFIGRAGSRVVYVPLIAHANLGNAESMVRWVELGQGRFRYDFTVMDKYLDLAEKHMGRPKLVVFNVWDVYMIPKKGNPTRGGHARMIRSFGKEQAEKVGTGPMVTLVDPKTGKTENVYLPTHFEAESKSLWDPLIQQIRERLRKRGLDGAMMFGMVTDAYPSKPEVELFHAIAPGVPWVSHGHGGFTEKQLLQGVAPVGYQACVWYTRFADEVPTHGSTWGQKRLYGWREDRLIVAFERNPGLDSFPLTRWRLMGETNITGGQRGMGRIGADYWLVIKDRRGRRVGTVSARYPESKWMNLNICNALLGPGPDGPVATTRFEAFREGLQECEARIFIERALTDERLRGCLGPALARRCQEALDERAMAMWKTLSNLQLTGPGWANATGWRWIQGAAGHLWFLGSDWQARTERLYTLAGEVARRLKAGAPQVPERGDGPRRSAPSP